MAEPLISFEGWCATEVYSIAQMGQRDGHKVIASECRGLDREVPQFDTAGSVARTDMLEAHRCLVGEGIAGAFFCTW
jgi:hypothetical protein